MKSSTLLIVGAGILAVILFTRKSSPVMPIQGAYPGTNTTAGNVGAIAGASATLVNAFKGLFSGPTTQPLTSGASPSNPNELAGLPTAPLPDDPFVGDLSY